jgi:hypothetical protein
VKLAQVRKLVVAVLGIVALAVPTIITPDVSDAALVLVDAVVGVLTAFGVYQVRNEPPA